MRRFTYLFPLDRLPARLAQVAIDALICVASFAVAYLVRFEGDIPAKWVTQLITLAPFLAFLRVASHLGFGVYRVVWRYVGVREALLFARSVAAVSFSVLLLRLLHPGEGALLQVPISIIVVEGTFTFVGMSASRLLRRLLHEHSEKKQSEARGKGTATLLAGAGKNGLAIAKEALQHPALGFRPIGFLDDDRTKTGMALHGLRVLGTLDDVEETVRRLRVKQIIITTNAIPAKAILAVMDRCRPLGVHVRIVPGLFELLGTDFKAASLREVRIEDLLSRDPVEPSMSVEDLREIYRGKRILVTGAGGSIGSELARQLVLMEPARLLLLERDENNLFEIHREITAHRLDDVCEPLLVDVAHERHLEQVFREHRPEVVFHAAAFKHVPMMERFPAAAIRNNVLGTHHLAELSHRYGAESFVMISTDKAVNPSSVMGASKRFAELLVQRLAPGSSTRFSCVRFGNVLGSRGSVIPIFRGQIRRGGPVTVTHPEATRYFMTIPEAANLVLQAATQGDSGEIFLLDMGQPVKILELARQMIHLSGATEEQVPIEIVGTRPGEKLFEELRTDSEHIEKTELRKIFRVKPESFEEAQVVETLERLDFATRAHDADGVRGALADLGIGYAGRRNRPATAEPMA